MNHPLGHPNPEAILQVLHPAGIARLVLLAPWELQLQ